MVFQEENVVDVKKQLGLTIEGLFWANWDVKHVQLVTRNWAVYPSVECRGYINLRSRVDTDAHARTLPECKQHKHAQYV